MTTQKLTDRPILETADLSNFMHVVNAGQSFRATIKTILETAFSFNDTGFSLTGGTTPKTLIVSEDCEIDQNLSTISAVSFSTVNGRNITLDGAKLDTIETGADVTDSSNVIPAIAGQPIAPSTLTTTSTVTVGTNILFSTSANAAIFGSGGTLEGSTSGFMLSATNTASGSPIALFTLKASNTRGAGIKWLHTDNVEQWFVGRPYAGGGVSNSFVFNKDGTTFLSLIPASGIIRGISSAFKWQANSITTSSTGAFEFTEGSGSSIRGGIYYNHSTAASNPDSIEFKCAGSTVTARLTTSLFSVLSSNFSIGSGAIATSATNGFIYNASCAGTPTGSATAITGRIPFVLDSTNKVFYGNFGGTTWLPIAFNTTSGTFNPTGTGVLNVSSVSTTAKNHFIRVGNEVTFTGNVTVSLSGSVTNFGLTISLPIASNFTSADDLRGFGMGQSSTDPANRTTLFIIAETGTDTALISIGGLNSATSNDIILNYEIKYTVK